MKVIDMHCDTIAELYVLRQNHEAGSLKRSRLHIDLEKMKQGDYGLQNFALYVNLKDHVNAYEYARELACLFHEEMDKNRDMIGVVRNWTDIENNWKDGKMSAMLTLEEGGICQGELSKLHYFYEQGARMMTLTWNFENELAYPNYCTGHVWKPDTERGLKERGIEFVREMERIGMIIDVSHLNDAGIRDVFLHTQKPFVASHSNARAVAGHPRNLTDAMLRELSERGGVAGINYMSFFLRDEEGPVRPLNSYMSEMIRHMKHMRQVGGIECIGLGSDFDGIPSIVEFENAAGMQRLAEEMAKEGFTESEIEAVFHKNVLRVYKEILN